MKHFPVDVQKVWNFCLAL